MSDQKTLEAQVLALQQELAQKEAKIKESEDLFNEILEGTLAGFWDWDIEHNTEYLSPTFKAMFGYVDDEMESSPEAWQKIIHPDDLPLVFEHFDAHVKSKGVIPFDNYVRYFHKDGNIVNVSCRGKVVEWLANGDPKRMVGSHVEVTELVSANDRFKMEAQRCNLIIQGVNAGVWDFHFVTGEEWWSPKFYEILGYKPHELHCSYDNFLRIVHPDDKVVLNNAIKDHLHQKHSVKVHIRVQNKNEQYIWVEACGQAIWNEEGTAIRMAGSLVDIHQRKLQEAHQVKVEQVLNETGAIAKVGGWELTLGDMQPHWSDQVYHIHEVPLGKQPPLDEALLFFPPIDRAIVEKLLQDAVEKGEGFDREFNFITAKKNQIFVRSICMPILDEFGKTVKLKGVFQDITEKKKQEIMLRDSLSVLGEQNKRLQGFAHIVSHNLNSHASNIQMLSKFLSEAKNEADWEQYLDMLKDASQQLETTIFDLNEIVSIQNQVTSSLKKLHFADSFKNLEKTLSAFMQEEKVEINLNFKVSSVDYIPAYLDSIFLNFITNAIKYKHPDRDPIIDIHTFEDKQRKVWLTFQDNGMGINLPRHGHKLFGMYKTFSKHPDSKGLGLFITKTQVESLKGEIQVESELEKGTKFSIRLN